MKNIRNRDAAFCGLVCVCVCVCGGVKSIAFLLITAANPMPFITRIGGIWSGKTKWSHEFALEDGEKMILYRCSFES